MCKGGAARRDVLPFLWRRPSTKWRFGSFWPALAAANCCRGSSRCHDTCLRRRQQPPTHHTASNSSLVPCQAAHTTSQHPHPPLHSLRQPTTQPAAAAWSHAKLPTPPHITHTHHHTAWAAAVEQPGVADPHLPTHPIRPPTHPPTPPAGGSAGCSPGAAGGRVSTGGAQALKLASRQCAGAGGSAAQAGTASALSPGCHPTLLAFHICRADPAIHILLLLF